MSKNQNIEKISVHIDRKTYNEFKEVCESHGAKAPSILELMMKEEIKEEKLYE